MSISQLGAARSITGNYFYRQGLRWIPFGFLFVLFGLTLLGPIDEFLASLFVIVGLGAAFAANALIGSYYAHSFGAVRGLPGRHRARTRIKWLVVYPAMAGSLAVDLLMAPPVLVSGVVWGAAIIAYRRSTGGGRLHLSVLGCLVATSTFVPLTGVANGDRAVGLFFVVWGLVYVVAGALDHRELAATLASHD